MLNLLFLPLEMRLVKSAVDTATSMGESAQHNQASHSHQHKLRQEAAQPAPFKIKPVQAPKAPQARKPRKMLVKAFIYEKYKKPDGQVGVKKISNSMRVIELDVSSGSHLPMTGKISKDGETVPVKYSYQRNMWITTATFGIGTRV